MQYTKASVFHGLETLVAFLLSAFLCWLFKEPLQELAFSLVRNTEVSNSLASGTALLLGAVIAGGAKYMRANPNVPMPDYVNTPK